MGAGLSMPISHQSWQKIGGRNTIQIWIRILTSASAKHFHLSASVCISNLAALVVGGMYFTGSSGKQVKAVMRSLTSWPELVRSTFSRDGKISVSRNIRPRV